VTGYDDGAVQILVGDCREVLATLPAESIQCVVTSPPYWGLRDYGIVGQIGLEPTPALYVSNIVEVFRAVRRVLRGDGTVWLNLGSSYAFGDSSPNRSLRGARAYDNGDTAPQGSQDRDSSYPDLCDGCRVTLGAHSVNTARRPPSSSCVDEPRVRDMSRLDSEQEAPRAWPLAAPASTMHGSSSRRREGCRHCANCGACLAVLRSFSRDAQACARRTGGIDDTTAMFSPSVHHTGGTAPSSMAWGHYASTLKPKDMVPIPWMVAMALQTDGWYLRADIIWAKPNPMPESLTDRPTKAHEYVFLLSKNERYFYDAEAIKEPYPENTNRHFRSGTRLNGNIDNSAEDLRGAAWHGQPSTTRNRRSVWTIASEPYPEAHFATFPTDLVAPCILAGTSERGCCAQCGAPWGRVVERTAMVIDRSERTHAFGRTRASGTMLEPPSSITTGWRPSCACSAAVVPCTVLDPFAGSGTALYVAKEYGRRAIGIDLNPAYGALAQARLRQGVLALGAG